MTAAAREYTTIDKSAWPRGAWDHEPDKRQWVDPSTSLDCLIVRGPHGALCGYVGISDTHPLFGIGYSDCIQKPPCGESWCDHSPGSMLHVHGGITFADTCHEPTEEEWLQVAEALNDPHMIAEAERYPTGDSAERLKELHAQNTMTIDEWMAYQQSRRICHLPEPGRPAKVWWFGFDCAHCDDRTPKFERPAAIFSGEQPIYRDRAYVEAECASLAEQLLACANGTGPVTS